MDLQKMKSMFGESTKIVPEFTSNYRPCGGYITWV